MKFLKILSAVLFPLAASLLCWSCKIVALGSELDLSAPRLAISSPNFAEIVPENFELAGTVEDNVMPAELTVSIEKVDREWRNLRGAWEIRETPEEPWQPCEGTWMVDKTRVSWTVPISLAGIPTGEYVITIKSFDEVRNSDAQSVQRVKITYNNENPVLAILNPVLKAGTFNRVPQALNDMDDNSRRDLSLQGELFNQSLTLNYEIEGGDFSSGGTLTLSLSGEPDPADLDKPELAAGDIWYEKTISGVKRSGSVIITGAEILNSAGKRPASGRTPLRVISRVTDGLGRTEYKSSGWFMWWPESDEPWAVFPAGSDPARDPYDSFYVGGENTAYAYDDDGVASLKYWIYQWDQVTRQRGTLVEGPKDLNFGENQSEWTFTVPGTPGDYMIEALVTDIHGKTGTIEKAWFNAKKRPAAAHKYLTRISSTNPDGYYTGGVNSTSGVELEISLDFDVPVKIKNTPRLELNVQDVGSPAAKIYAVYFSGTGEKTLVFKYQSLPGHHTPGTAPLDVAGFDTSTGVFIFEDEYGTDIIINNDVQIPSDPDYRLSGQKKIHLIRGAPAMSPPVLDEKGVLTVDFTWDANPFSWNLIRGSGTLTLKITDADYRIPTVIPEARYLEYGISSAVNTDTNGKSYYERTINGAFSDGRTDTDPKYVLRFDLDPADFESSAASLNHKNLRKAIKDKETISLSAYSSLISLSGHTMTVNLGSFLPVKGVSYRCAIPAGFLGVNPIGLSSSQKDVNVLFPGIEKPFFRIEKTDETFDGAKRQARQPVTAQVKLDCRTPNAEIYYTDPTDRASFTIDPVEPILFDSEWLGPYFYPVPQPKPAQISNTAVPEPKPTPKALNVLLPAQHTPVKSDTARSVKYGSPFEIGSDNYALGGMAYRLGARAYSGSSFSDVSYEVAYRSVLVLNNAITNGYSQVNGTNAYGFESRFLSPDTDGKTTRVWITGGDSVAGAVRTPGFPLDWRAHEGVRLMTPIGTHGTDPADAYRSLKIMSGHINGANTSLTDSSIPSTYDVKGHYTWYWITWKLGTAAYVQFQRRILADSPSSPPYFNANKQMSPFKQGWNELKEYYPVFPGETRVVNPRTPYWYSDNGNPGEIKYYNVLGKRDASIKWAEPEATPAP
jgi:hypothetical protein